MSRLFLVSLVAATAVGQAPAASGSSIEGTVVNERTNLALRRAHLVLRPAQAGLSSIGVDTDDKGSFVIQDIAPGRYSLSASRDGYLASSVCLIGTLRLPQTFTIHTKESVTNLQFRLRPFAVMAGRVAFDDGEPAMNVRVVAYREYRNRLRRGYLVAGSAATNDLGEYRMFGLAPGAYIVAAEYERPVPAGEQIRDAAAPRYTTTFFTNATKLSEAVPVRLDYGQEIGGVDVFLERVRKVRIRGRVISGVSGETVPASIALERVDAHNASSLAVLVPATFDRSNHFEIREVTPGPYIIWAQGGDGGKVLVAHAPLVVGASDVDDVELTVVGDRAGSAVVLVEGGAAPTGPVVLRFEPRNDRAKVVEAQQEAGGGGFHFLLTGGDVYDPFVTNLPGDYYLSAVRVNGVDQMPFGIDGSAASADRPFQLVIDARGGRVSGRVLGPDDSLWSRASLALIPDPPAGRVQSYREGSADENGSFLVRGVAPGKYILVAWLDEPPCDIYDPEWLGNCRASGISVEVQQAGEQNVELKMKNFGRR